MASHDGVSVTSTPRLDTSIRRAYSLEYNGWHLRSIAIDEDTGEWT